MNLDANTPRVKRSIGGKIKGDDGSERALSFDVNVPQPYSAGAHTLTEGEANALNQVIAENLSNNMRAKVLAGKTEGEGDSATTRDFTEAEVQELVDSYLAEYEIGVRRAGSGEPRVTDPVEKEARAIARQKAIALVRENGGKPADYDLVPITDSIFEANRDLLMGEAKKIVRAREAAKAKGDGLDLTGISLAPKAPAQAAA